VVAGGSPDPKDSRGFNWCCAFRQSAMLSLKALRGQDWIALIPSVNPGWRSAHWVIDPSFARLEPDSLRGQDLNLRPSGYEANKKNHITSRSRFVSSSFIRTCRNGVRIKTSGCCKIVASFFANISLHSSLYSISSTWPVTALL